MSSRTTATIGVSDDKVPLYIDDIRAGARKNLLPREPRLRVLPKRKRGSGRKQNRQNAMTVKRKAMHAAKPPAASTKAKTWRQANVIGSGMKRSNAIRTSHSPIAALRTIKPARAPASPLMPADACAMGTFTSEPVSRTRYR